jgi:glycosyltransferase involved in cell wall biosynthesis
LYLGAASELRGFFQFLDAAVLLAREHPDAVFRALLRGATDRQMDEIVRGSIPASLRERFTFLGGWLEPRSLRAEISKAHAVVLPFVLVPAELPLSVMEALACGTPVITTNLAGLPNVVGSCGLVVEPGDTRGLFSAMRVLQEDKRTLSAIERRCRTYSEAPRGWLDAVVEWESLLLAGLAHP